jgi:hypothetical protein
MAWPTPHQRSPRSLQRRLRRPTVAYALINVGRVVMEILNRKLAPFCPVPTWLTPPLAWPTPIQRGLRPCAAWPTPTPSIIPFLLPLVSPCTIPCVLHFYYFIQGFYPFQPSHNPLANLLKTQAFPEASRSKCTFFPRASGLSSNDPQSSESLKPGL